MAGGNSGYHHINHSLTAWAFPVYGKASMMIVEIDLENDGQEDIDSYG